MGLRALNDMGIGNGAVKTIALSPGGHMGLHASLGESVGPLLGSPGNVGPDTSEH